MRIPKSGMRVGFVMRPASKDDKIPAEIRPAEITRVHNYSSDSATVNLIVTLDGPTDVEIVRSKGYGNIDGFHLHCTNVNFDQNEQREMTFHFYEMTPHSVEDVIVRADIMHGREMIRAGAIGVHDQLKNTITFPREMVQNCPTDMETIYRADLFIDQHCARLDAPNGHIWINTRAIDDGTERPWEHNRFLESNRDAFMQRVINDNSSILKHIARLMGVPEEALMNAFNDLPQLPAWQFPRTDTALTDKTTQEGGRVRSMEVQHDKPASQPRVQQHAGAANR